TSARASWNFGSSESWRGSRVEFTLEDEARRRGGARFADVFLSTGLALVDQALQRASGLQRPEAQGAPRAPAAPPPPRAGRGGGRRRDVHELRPDDRPAKRRAALARARRRRHER